MLTVLVEQVAELLGVDPATLTRGTTRGTDGTNASASRLAPAVATMYQGKTPSWPDSLSARARASVVPPKMALASECATPIPSARTLVGNWSAYKVAAAPP